MYGFDLDHANQSLDEAGYVDTDGDGIREKDGVKPVSYTHLDVYKRQRWNRSAITGFRRIERIL